MTPDLLVLYEDENWKSLWPLSATRPVWDLRLGVRCLWEKTRDIWKPLAVAVESSGNRGRAPIVEAFAARRELAVEAESEQARGSILWWNGAAIPLGAPPDAGPTLTEGVRLVDSTGAIVGVWHRAEVPSARAMALTKAGAPLPSDWRELPCEVVWVRQLWDLLTLLDHEIDRDVQALGDPGGTPTLPNVHLLGTRISVARDVRIDPGCVLDARPGPIVIAEGASLAPFTHLEGPAIIGESTQLLGGRLSRVALGPQCRVGGEVEATIFRGYANKRHQGFLGHAVVGEWVNLGALTTNSDLKNTYGAVRVWVEGKERDSGESKVGCFIGDHVKTGIGTLIATGAVIGPGSNLFAGGQFTPKHVPGWSWWDGERAEAHAWDKFIETARTAMGRRERELTPTEEAALRAAWEAGPRTR
ncbi:MAG TPA: putative sugar nucleotidyl transferase [Candidatus Eisenbacteria bacterium]|nr:putative sugar nucleotidyl transferase [Candidatus Eisenbacteria bacterium]